MIAILLALLAVVNTPNPSVSYTCDGSTAAYVVNFPYLANTDLQVTSTTPAGIGTTLAQTTDWSVNLASTSSTATLTLNAPGTKCPSGNVLKIARSLALTQPYSFKAQSTYNQTLHETAYDREVMLIQQTDAKVSSTDVKAYVDAAISATLTGGQNVQPITWNVTGDGAANVFSISNAVVNSPDLYIVTIDGVFQRPSTDYTVSVATAQITFASVPALNAVISVRSFGYARALSVGDNTSVLATGSTVPRDLAHRFAHLSSVCDFETICPNGVDDTAAINAAVAALPAGGAVRMPAGIVPYKTTSTLALPSNVTLLADGPDDNLITTIIYTGSGWAVDLTDKASVGLKGVTIQIGATALGCFRIRGVAYTSESRHRLIDTGCVASAGRTAGQVGYLMQTDTAIATLYHNIFIHPTCNALDSCMKFVSLVNSQGPNGNYVSGLRVNGHSVGVRMLDGTDNVIVGPVILGKDAGVANPIAIQMGGTGTGGYCTANNVVTGIISEQNGAATTVVVTAPAGCTQTNAGMLFEGSANDATAFTDGTTSKANVFNFSNTVTIPTIKLATPTGTAPMVVTSTTPVANLSLSGGSGSSIFTSTFGVSDHISNTGIGLKHARIGGCATAAVLMATCDTTVTWSGSNMANTNYTAVCTGDNITSGVPLNGGVVSKAVGSLSFRTVAGTAAAAQYTAIDCYAFSD